MTSNGQKLPKGVYFKHGAYYLVRQNKWIKIGPEFTKDGYDRADRVAPQNKAPRLALATLENYLRKKFTIQSSTAKSRGLVCEISVDEVISIAKEQGWCCAITGRRFSLEQRDGKKTLPFAPSVDRIDSAYGYVHGNCRLVTVLANVAKNQWSDDTLLEALGGPRLDTSKDFQGRPLQRKA